jgi:hypothetical protein
MLTTQSEKFQKFEFKFHAGISSNTWQKEIEQILITVSCTVLPRSNPVAMLLDTSAVDPSSLRPDPSRATWEEKRTAPGPPLSSPSSSLQAPDHHDRARADPQHSAVETKALQHASKTVEASVARALRQNVLRHPPTGRPRPRRSGL